MFAMLAAFGAEVSTRTPVFVQIQKAPLAILATFVIIITASVCLLQYLAPANLREHQRHLALQKLVYFAVFLHTLFGRQDFL